MLFWRSNFGEGQPPIPGLFPAINAASPAPSSGSTSTAMPSWTWSINSAASSSPTSTTSVGIRTDQNDCVSQDAIRASMLVRIAASPRRPPSISSPACPSPPSPARRKRPAPGTPKTHKKLFWTRCSLARADAAIAIAAEIFCRNALYAANDKGFVTFFRRRKLLGLRS